METVNKGRIRQTVMEVLKNSDMEEMTEFKVRVEASERLGIDLSDANHKRFIRGVVESFLLSTTESTDNRIEPDLEVEEQRAQIGKRVNDEGDSIICKLSNKRTVAIQEFKGRAFVSIREYFRRDGKLVPTAKDLNPVVNKKDVANSVTSPLELFPTELHRFNGKNYRVWAQQIELLLKQLKVAYVLTDPCPIVTLCPQASSEEVTIVNAAERKWLNDNNICRHHILNFLSDHLYYQYSKRTSSAKELWEELKLVYLDEEFGTKRSQVKKYIEFQMFDEKSVFEQALELNKIADSIVAAGMMIYENFHVSVILSKLPLSWKDFCIKLMRMEYLTFTMLMDHIKAEEECRSRNKQEEPSKFVELSPAVNFGPRMREMSKKRRESEMDSKTVVCYNCRKKGHVAKHCHNKRLHQEINDNYPC